MYDTCDVAVTFSKCIISLLASFGLRWQRKSEKSYRMFYCRFGEKETHIFEAITADFCCHIFSLPLDDTECK